MDEKTMNKIEAKDPRAREEIEAAIKQNDNKICPYAVRVYDFIGIMGRQGNGGHGRQIAVQCIYKGTIHNPQESCLGNFTECEKYKELEKHEELMQR